MTLIFEKRSLSKEGLMTMATQKSIKCLHQNEIVKYQVLATPNIDCDRMFSFLLVMNKKTKPMNDCFIHPI